MSEKIKLLIVDDRLENLIAMEAVLTSSEYELVTAQSGKEALKYMLKHEFAVVLLDVQMPGLNGFETAKLIKARDKSKDVPIIFVTAISKDITNVSKGYESGAIDYLFKPINPYVLKNKVASFVELYKSKKKIEREKERIQIETEKIKKSYLNLESIIQQRTNDLMIANNELKSLHERFKKIFEFSPIPLAIRLIEDGSFLTTNHQWSLLTGYGNTELNNREASILTIKAAEEENPGLKSLDLISGLRNKKVIVQTKSGEMVDALLSTETVTISNQTSVISALIDVTQLKKYEKQMTRFDQLNLVGEMAAGIAHEIRNPMTTVHGFLQLTKSDNVTEESSKYINLMIEELSRANSIITEFLSLVKQPETNMKIQDINLIIEKLFPLLQAEALMENKTVKKTLGLCKPIQLDEKEIKQLILNIGLNGLEAMSAGGTLSIETSMMNEEVVLIISDDGPGMSKDVLEKVGTPFFTTKQKGTGLGLAICYRIAAKHFAEIDIQSSKQGTTFTITFTNKRRKKGS